MADPLFAGVRSVAGQVRKTALLQRLRPGARTVGDTLTWIFCAVVGPGKGEL